MQFQKFPSYKNAFTLNEILVVIIIIGVLAALALPRMGIIMERMRAKEGEQILFSIDIALQDYFIDHDGNYPDSVDELAIEIPPSKYFNQVTFFENGIQSFQVERKTETYVLHLLRNRSCSNVTMSCENEPARIECTNTESGLCEKLGYTTISEE